MSDQSEQLYKSLYQSSERRLRNIRKDRDQLQEKLYKTIAICGRMLDHLDGCSHGYPANQNSGRDAKCKCR